MCNSIEYVYICSISLNPFPQISHVQFNALGEVSMLEANNHCFDCYKDSIILIPILFPIQSSCSLFHVALQCFEEKVMLRSFTRGGLIAKARGFIYSPMFLVSLFPHSLLIPMTFPFSFFSMQVMYLVSREQATQSIPRNPTRSYVYFLISLEFPSEKEFPQ